MTKRKIEQIITRLKLYENRIRKFKKKHFVIFITTQHAIKMVNEKNVLVCKKEFSNRKHM